jgi:hypothetical protein
MNKIIILFLYLQLNASLATTSCILKTKPKNWNSGDKIYSRLLISKMDHKFLRYSFVISSMKKKINCVVPRSTMGSPVDKKFPGWEHYTYGPRELDECLDAYVNTSKKKLALQATYDGAVTALYECTLQPRQ